MDGNIAIFGLFTIIALLLIGQLTKWIPQFTYWLIEKRENRRTKRNDTSS